MLEVDTEATGNYSCVDLVAHIYKSGGLSHLTQRPSQDLHTAPYPGIFWDLSTTMSSPTSTESTFGSPEGAVFRQDVQTLHELLANQPLKNHYKMVYHLWDSLANLQRNHALARQSSLAEERWSEDAADRLRQAEEALAAITEKCVTQHRDLQYLSMQVEIMSGNFTHSVPSHDEWEENYHLVLQLADAAEETDQNFQQMKTMKNREEQSRMCAKWGREKVQEFRKTAEELWQEYKMCEKEFEDVIGHERLQGE